MVLCGNLVYCEKLVFYFATVFTGIVYSTDTIVPTESHHIHCFNPLNLYPSKGYRRIIDQYISITQ